MKPTPARPWLLAVLTLGVALVPVWFAWDNHRAEARRKDAQLFEATSGLVAERLQLITVRHISLFNILRSQVRTLPAPTLDALRIPPTLKSAYPHLIAFGYAAAEENRAVLQWTDAAAAPAQRGTDLAENARAVFERITPGMMPGAVLEKGDRVFVVAAVGESARPRGYIVGWLDLASLCRDASIPLLRDGVLVATPLAEDAEPTAGARVFHIHEGEAQWRAAIVRGPRFAAEYGQLPPTLVFVACALSAVLLAFLVLQATRAAQLRAALDAERMRSRLVQAFSHEFRTPLSVILSGADLLESYAEQLAPARRAEVLAQIKDSTARMNEMVEQVLLLSRAESGGLTAHRAPLDAAALCHDLAREVRIATRDRCPVEVRAGFTAPLALDVTLLRSILGNLLANAVKYSAPGSPVLLEAAGDARTIRFTVRDSGRGIPPADLGRVREPFQRAGNVGDTPGTGLGLAIVERCVALHGGALALESREGAGTTATVTFPAA
jgi:signal transduction histidine kinase